MRRSDTKGVLHRVPATRSFDYLVGGREQHRRHREAEQPAVEAPPNDSNFCPT
jgi:hypothetical protein